MRSEPDGKLVDQRDCSAKAAFSRATSAVYDAEFTASQGRQKSEVSYAQQPWPEPSEAQRSEVRGQRSEVRNNRRNQPVAPKNVVDFHDVELINGAL